MNSAQAPATFNNGYQMTSATQAPSTCTVQATNTTNNTQAPATLNYVNQSISATQAPSTYAVQAPSVFYCPTVTSQSRDREQLLNLIKQNCPRLEDAAQKLYSLDIDLDSMHVIVQESPNQHPLHSIRKFLENEVGLSVGQAMGVTSIMATALNLNGAS